jgi:hypothetical protein
MLRFLYTRAKGFGMAFIFGVCSKSLGLTRRASPCVGVREFGKVLFRAPVLMSWFQQEIYQLWLSVSQPSPLPCGPQERPDPETLLLNTLSLEKRVNWCLSCCPELRQTDMLFVKIISRDSLSDLFCRVTLPLAVQRRKGQHLFLCRRRFDKKGFWTAVLLS